MLTMFGRGGQSVYDYFNYTWQGEQTVINYSMFGRLSKHLDIKCN